MEADLLVVWGKTARSKYHAFDGKLALSRCGKWRRDEMIWVYVAVDDPPFPQRCMQCWKP